ARGRGGGGAGGGWRWGVGRARARRGRLGELSLPLWQTFSEAYASRLRSVAPASRAGTERMLRSADHLAHHFVEAPVIVVVCVHIADLAITDAGLDRPPVVGGASIYPAVQNLMLACRNV